MFVLFVLFVCASCEKEKFKNKRALLLCTSPFATTRQQQQACTQESRILCVFQQAEQHAHHIRSHVHQNDSFTEHVSWKRWWWMACSQRKQRMWTSSLIRLWMNLLLMCWPFHQYVCPHTHTHAHAHSHATRTLHSHSHARTTLVLPVCSVFTLFLFLLQSSKRSTVFSKVFKQSPLYEQIQQMKNNPSMVSGAHN